MTSARDDLPLSADHAFARLHLDGSPNRQPHNALAGVEIQRTVLQDYAPLHRSLEHRISELAWAQAGVAAFSIDRVPHAVTSGGSLSQATARVFLAHCLETKPAGDFEILELGAGTGLFARLFLDAFQELCRSNKYDFYDRLTYCVTDASARMVERWCDLGQFAAHSDRVHVACVDAASPASLRLADGSPLRNVRAILCNYVFDALPTTVVRRRGTTIEELRVRTCLEADGIAIAKQIRIDPHRLAEQLDSGAITEIGALRTIASYFELETTFTPCLTDAPPFTEEALSLYADADRVLLNHDALACIVQSMQLLGPDGVLLVHDFGPTPSATLDAAFTFQRFGATSAIGVNFALIERFCEARGLEVYAPPGDERRPLRTRLIHRSALADTLRSMNWEFSAEAHEKTNAPIENARRHLAAGRKDEALAEYRLALERSPADWLVVGEVAEFVGLHVLDFATGLELATRAVQLNPWYSAWLWNVLGDCLLWLQRHEDAHEAYLQAQRINAGDARTNLNLASTLAHQGRLADALDHISAALSSDEDGFYRDRLLQKQQQILSGIAARAAALREKSARRAERLTNA